MLLNFFLFYAVCPAKLDHTSQAKENCIRKRNSWRIRRVQSRDKRTPETSVFHRRGCSSHNGRLHF